jgi:hypothetical protein
VLFHLQPTLYEAFPWLTVLSPILGAGDDGVPLCFILWATSSGTTTAQQDCRHHDQ